MSFGGDVRNNIFSNINIFKLFKTRSSFGYITGSHSQEYMGQSRSVNYLLFFLLHNCRTQDIVYMYLDITHILICT